MDEAHAQLVELVVAVLRATGWEVAVEVSFSISGERGAIDILAYHRATGIVLVVEVKSVVPDSQALLHGLDARRDWRGGLPRSGAGESHRWRVCWSSARRRRRGAGSTGWRRRTTRRSRCAGRRSGDGCVSRSGPCQGSCSSHLRTECALTTRRPPASGSGSLQAGLPRKGCANDRWLRGEVVECAPGTRMGAGRFHCP